MIKFLAYTSMLTIPSLMIVMCELVSMIPTK